METARPVLLSNKIGSRHPKSVIHHDHELVSVKEETKHVSWRSSEVKQLGVVDLRCAS